ncbi:protein LYK5-like [Iris pallida]|uniref:Protein LYK5-like n=2 Tax=Iris pallida TaxID=29817 RepID=A0AAX6F4L1_IRIPA|nr:protein LYK5-like [Iris pallida]
MQRSRRRLSCFIFSLFFFASGIKAQQGYSRNDVLDCNYPMKAAPSPSYLYTCSEPRQHSCHAFLIYKSRQGYNSTETISHLLRSDSSELARINNVSNPYIFPTNKEVIVPVNCSCSGQYYYQAITFYVIDSDDTYYSLANDQYQGLSSCSALMGENLYDAENLSVGLKLLVPLRCACPTRNQSRDGVKYLLTYSINENDTIPDISERFNVSVKESLAANGFTDHEEAVIYPNTTLLIPLQSEPLSSQTIILEPIVYAPPPVSTLSTVNGEPKRSKKKLHFGLGAGVASLAVLCLLSLLLRRCHRKKMGRIKGKIRSTPTKHILDAMCGIDRVLKVFDVDELKAATKDFSSECRIQGSVYGGMVGGTMVAIKRESRDVMSKEVNILYKLNHFNIISLGGISTGDQHCYLVYEYMKNGCLRDWLRDPSRSGLWNWTLRVQIATDVANGLDYLHNFSYPPYVHKDIKTSNVLLDTNMRAKITNFSLATSSDGGKEGPNLTKNVEGTLGYMAPEYLECGNVTPMLDVYSFGVVMAELITGKGAIVEHQGRRRLLSEMLISIVDGDNALEVLGDFVDPDLRMRSPIALVMEVAKLCVACLARDLGKRPNMCEVVSALSRIQRDTEMWALAYQ